MTTCQYCGDELEDQTKKACSWCNAIIQEANCHGIYLIDTAVAISRRDDLTSPDERRAAIQAKFDQLTA